MGNPFLHVFILEKIFLFRTSWPISIKFGTNHRRVKGIQVCSNKRLCRLQRRDNHKSAKIGWGHLKIFFSRITGPEKLIYTRKLPDVVQIGNCENLWPI
jgi:hypothetical protein